MDLESRIIRAVAVKPRTTLWLQDKFGPEARAAIRKLTQSGVIVNNLRTGCELKGITYERF